MNYGLPGSRTIVISAPSTTSISIPPPLRNGNSFENIMTRGLLYGTKYSAGDAYRGVWGLYGSYDYISPSIFRVSSTALSLGTTAQWWLSRSVALQGSALGGVGFGAAGTIAAVGDAATGIRDYHYGVVPQGLLALRLIFGNAAMLDLTGREYYVTGKGSDNANGSEHVFRGNTSFTMRVYGRHGIGIQYVESHRDAYYAALPQAPDGGDRQCRYNFLGDTKFGAVEWRDFYADRH
jgi:hypothetical protein